MWHMFLWSTFQIEQYSSLSYVLQCQRALTTENARKYGSGGSLQLIKSCLTLVARVWIMFMLLYLLHVSVNVVPGGVFLQGVLVLAYPIPERYKER